MTWTKERRLRYLLLKGLRVVRLEGQALMVTEVLTLDGLRLVSKNTKVREVSRYCKTALSEMGWRELLLSLLRLLGWLPVCY